MKKTWNAIVDALSIILQVLKAITTVGNITG